MLKVMETYRKGVEYYNSYGLKSASGTRKSKEGGKGSSANGGGTFWDLN